MGRPACIAAAEFFSIPVPEQQDGSGARVAVLVMLLVNYRLHLRTPPFEHPCTLSERPLLGKGIRSGRNLTLLKGL